MEGKQIMCQYYDYEKGKCEVIVALNKRLRKGMKGTALTEHCDSPNCTRDDKYPAVFKTADELLSHETVER